MATNDTTMQRSAGTWQVMVAGIALVVAASTLVSDFVGYFTLGLGFVVALALAFLLNLLLGLSAADLAATYPRAGALYEYAGGVLPGKLGAHAGVFLALAFFLMAPLAVAGEVGSGAFALQRLVGHGVPIEACIVALATLAVVPCLFGLRGAAWASAGLLVLMLGIRWFFGLAGFCGWGGGEWSVAHLETESGFRWFGEGGVLSEGLALALWTFVGIEFACALSEEVRDPGRSMPRGIVLGLLIILATSLVMGLGVAGSMPLGAWREQAFGAAGAGGAAPQLAVGRVMFGAWGELAMAVASVAATIGSLTVMFTALPRVLFGMARDGKLFGRFSRPLARLSPNSGQPVAATLLTFLVFLVPALASHDVVSWIYSAAYVWILLYVAFHLLAAIRRIRGTGGPGAFSRWFLAVPLLGVPLTSAGVYLAFQGGHRDYGVGAVVVLGVAGLVTVASAAIGAVERPTTQVTALGEPVTDFD